MPQSSAIWCAIGKRLVDFFGGRLEYCDDKNTDDPKNYYLPKKPKFPAVKLNEDRNKRFYKYYELLNNETVLAPQEINSMKEHCFQFTYTDQEMVLFLEKYLPIIELNKELSEELSNNNNNNKNKKLKV
jgi:hypothetical protein